MAVYESGRESSLLDDITAGRKTIECRLNRGKFAQYAPGDLVWLRRDTYRDGAVVDQESHAQLVKIVSVTGYPTFQMLVEKEGISASVPRAASVAEAVAECHKYYSPQEEAEYGVLGIKFELSKAAELEDAK